MQSQLLLKSPHLLNIGKEDKLSSLYFAALVCSQRFQNKTSFSRKVTKDTSKYSFVLRPYMF